MQSAIEWIGDPQSFPGHHGDDIVPDGICLATWEELGTDALGSSLRDFAVRIVKKINSAHAEQNGEAVLRARSVLRLCLALAVRCCSVSESDVLEITEIVATDNNKLMRSETRFIQSGGNCSHAGAFPFAHGPPSGKTRNAWRRRIKLSKRLHVDDERFMGEENVFSKDIIIYVLRFCDVRTVGRASAISREWFIAAGQDVVWRKLFLRKWPEARGVMANFKARYVERVKSVRKMKLPIGRRSIPKPHYCEWCDVAFPTLTASKVHMCFRKKQTIIREKLAAEAKAGTN